MSEVHEKAQHTQHAQPRPGSRHSQKREENVEREVPIFF